MVASGQLAHVLGDDRCGQENLNDPPLRPRAVMLIVFRSAKASSTAWVKLLHAVITLSAVVSAALLRRRNSDVLASPPQARRFLHQFLTCGAALTAPMTDQDASAEGHGPLQQVWLPRSELLVVSTREPRPRVSFRLR